MSIDPAQGSDVDSAVETKPCKPHVLLGVSGSVATVKLAQLVTTCSKFAEVQVVCTQRAKTFFDYSDLACTVFDDSMEWDSWKRLGDPVLHIEVTC